MDSHSGSGNGYEVQSLYFDTPTLGLAQEKEAGLFSRKKYRIRTYAGSGFYTFEVKSKEGSAGFKDTIPIDRDLAERLHRGNLGETGVRGNALDAFIAKRKARLVQPAVTVSYSRTAYCYGPGRVRITLDENIRAYSARQAFPDGLSNGISVLERGAAVLEVKFTGFLSQAVKSLLTLPSRPNTAVSKYLLCLRAAPDGTYNSRTLFERNI